MKIIFATDYVCPYCIVGKAALLEAIKEMNLEVEIETCPMELTLEPEPQVDTWNDENRREHYKVLFAPAKELGIDAKFPPYVVPRPYTRLAFEGHYYAVDQGVADIYDDAVYKAYFVEEKNIGDPSVLASIAEKAGLNRTEFLKVLEKGIYTELVHKMDTRTKEEFDIHSVPTLMIHGEKIQFKEYTKEEAKELLRKYL